MGTPAIAQTQVLVLNKNYQPINVTNVKRAFVMMYLDLAHAVDHQFRVFDFEQWTQVDAENDDEALHTATRRFKIPRVILLLAYDRMPIGRVRFSRHNVFARDNHTCQYCWQQLKASALNLDHVLPRSRGGKTSWENVVCSCVPCNLKKGRRTPEEAGYRLLKQPARPRWSAIMRHPMSRARFEDWRPYLGLIEGGHRHSHEG